MNNEHLSSKLYLHIDADAFFASVEQCLHPHLKGQATVTGRDASIVLALSYEAKALGIERGLPTHLLHRDYPEVYMVDSDYHSYRTFSQRMFRIISSHLPKAEQMSIDECRSELPYSLKQIDEAKNQAVIIKEELELKLGCSFSVGLARTPILAKIASDMEKPSGFTTILDSQSYERLCALSIEKVPGFGRNLSPRLRTMGIGTIEQFIRHYEDIKDNFTINVKHIYLGLTQQYSAKRPTKPLQSMNRARSFSPTDNLDFLTGQLTLNVEYLLRTLRRKQLRAQHIYVYVRDAQRTSYGTRSSLSGPSDNHERILKEATRLLSELYQPGTAYRYVSITLGRLTNSSCVQLDLFNEYQQDQEQKTLWDHIDERNRRLGGDYITTASSLLKPRKLGSHINTQQKNIISKHKLLPKEHSWRRLNYPFLGCIH